TFVIGAGVEDRFCPATPSRALDPRPIVTISGADDRKNVDALLAAWLSTPDDFRRRHRLVVAGSSSVAQQRRWRATLTEYGRGHGVELRGVVGDGELIELLQHAHLTVIPYLEE